MDHVPSKKRCRDATPSLARQVDSAVTWSGWTQRVTDPRTSVPTDGLLG